MKQLLAILLCFIAFSCNDMETKKVNSDDLLAEELKTFNWNDVDEYPSFASCDSTSGKENKKQCFEMTLRQILNENLSQYNLVVSESLNDTVELKIHIDKDGVFSIKTISSDAATQEQLPELDSILRESLDSLPIIYPAIKRSQQVATEFRLPVVVKID